MHLNVCLPKVQPAQLEQNRKRVWGGTQFKAHQQYSRKPIRDTRHAQVIARRYRCLKCQRTFAPIYRRRNRRIR